MNKLETLREQISALQEQAKVEAKELFHTGAKELFEKHPEIKAFKWTQYTPYFNDGETCVFSSNHGYAGVQLVTDSDEDFEESVDNGGDNKAVSKFLDQFTDEDMENLFGDHVQVTVTAENIEVDEYVHD